MELKEIEISLKTSSFCLQYSRFSSQCCCNNSIFFPCTFLQSSYQSQKVSKMFYYFLLNHSIYQIWYIWISLMAFQLFQLPRFWYSQWVYLFSCFVELYLLNDVRYLVSCLYQSRESIHSKITNGYRYRQFVISIIKESINFITLPSILYYNKGRVL